MTAVLLPPFTNEFPMWKGDTKPPLQVQVLNPDGTPRDVTADAIVFNMGLAGQGRKINGGAVTKVAATLGVVQYQWQANDTNTEGNFRGTFVLNGVDTYPKGSFILIPITSAV